MEQIKLVIALVSLLLNTGLFGLLLKFNNQWYTVRERCDILWLHYCNEHDIPFRSVGKDFERRKD